jgi:outer membrane receptor protein involved in Fe transport
MQTYGGPNRKQFAPRASLKYDLGDDSVLRASYGRFYQAQGINELQVEDGVDTFFGAQRADQAIVSFDRALRADWRLRVEAYRKEYANLRPRIEALFDPLVLIPELASDRVRIAPSEGEVEGVELLVSRRSEGPWNGWLSYGWSRAVDRVDGKDELRSWDQTHSVSAGVTWQREPWTVTIADTYHTGWPTTGVRLLTPPGGEPSVEVGPRNAKRLERFTSLDARASRRFPLPRGDLEVYVEVSNLTASSNPCCNDYSVRTLPDGSSELVREESDWLGILPSAGVLWRY